MRTSLQAVPDPVRRWRRIGAVASLLVLQLLVPAAAQTAPAAASAVAPAGPAAAPVDDIRASSVVLNHRTITTFRTSLLGRTPRDRAVAGNFALQVVLGRGGPGEVTLWHGDNTVGLQLDGVIVFYLVPDDLPPGTTLQAAADDARARLQHAVLEAREAGNLRSIGRGLAYAAGATLIAYLLVRLVFMIRRRAVARIASLLDHLNPQHAGKELVAAYVPHAKSGVLGMATLGAWALALLVVYSWATFVLRQFAYTRPWGERSRQWLLEVLEQFALGISEAVPGLLIAVLIFFIARAVSRANALLMQRVERSDLHLAWIDRDTAGPTRRIGNVVIWLFALAMAYPFLPGANSDAFKGVSVLAGLMLSLGASGVVGQMMSGLSLMYSRALRAGEYVRIGDVEGTVAAVGLIATRVHTGLGEEVSLPNSVVLGQAMHNYSRLVPDGQFIVHTAITIGYATPWRQVHAMLQEAARRTTGLASEPPPHVVQTGLSDFYVEYRLCAQSNRLAPRQRAELMGQLHGNVQDVFNENGVQIMSPHYVADPSQRQVVAPDGWSPGLAPAAQASKNESA